MIVVVYVRECLRVLAKVKPAPMCRCMRSADLFEVGLPSLQAMDLRNAAAEPRLGTTNRTDVLRRTSHASIQEEKEVSLRHVIDLSTVRVSTHAQKWEGHCVSVCACAYQ